MADLIIGRNACMEALKTGRKIETLTVLKQNGTDRKNSRDGKNDKVGKNGRDGKSSSDGKNGRDKGSLQKIIAMAAQQGIRVTYADRATLDRMAEGNVHQGVIASAAEYQYASLEELLQTAKDRGEAPLLVLLDGLEDPHNLGAIMRTAECAGAHGVVIPQRRSVTVNETVMKTSAGAAQYISCARVTNMARAIDQLKEAGLWIYGCDMDGSSCFGTDLTGPAAIVIGNEGRGLSRIVREKCDFVISIPMKGQINSLNASNAAAIVLYESLRQRG